MATQRAATTSGSDLEARGHLLSGLPVTQRRELLAGVSTAVLEGGDGPPVLLLHGPGGNATHWMEVIPDLARTHRMIAPDLPGQGESWLTDDGALDVERVVAWLRELIETTCPSPPVVVGYALGGAIAMRFAAEHGDRLSRLVLVDALGLTGFEPAPEFGRALNGFLAQPTEQTFDDLWRYCALDLDGVRGRIGERWEPFTAYNLDRARTPSVMAALGGLMAHFGLPAIPPAELERIAAPTTLIWGRDDLATALSIAEAASDRYGWALQVIEDCADDPPIEQPAAFLRALRPALGAHGVTVPVSEPHERALAAAGFRGEIVGRDDTAYDDLRKVFNGMIDRRPALIARCADARDVSAAVNFARDSSLSLSVYGGGHNVTGNAVCDDGVTIDLRPMKGIEIDAEARTCRAGAGLTWGELDAATQQHGLAVTGGRISTTGLGGLVLGGGRAGSSACAATRSTTCCPSRRSQRTARS